MSATRPCSEFSIGISARPARPLAHRVDRILESEAGQRQRVGKRLHHRDVRIGARRALKGDRTIGIGGRGGGHLLDEGGGGGGIGLHCARAMAQERAGRKRACAAGFAILWVGRLYRALVGRGQEAAGNGAKRGASRGMDDRSNTIAGWVLFAGIAALGLSVVTGEYFHAERPEKMGYTVEGVEAEGGGDTATAAELPIETYLAKADPAKGADVFKKCGACHTDREGRPQRDRPATCGTSSADAAARAEAGFAFSDALKAQAAIGTSIRWTSG